MAGRRSIFGANHNLYLHHGALIACDAMGMGAVKHSAEHDI